MKALFYIDTLDHGGAERVISNLANDLLSLGYQTTVVTTTRKEVEYPLDIKVTRYSMDEEYNASFRKRNFKLFKRLRSILKKEKPDVAIAFLPESIFRLATASVGLKIKKIYSVRSDPRFVYKSLTYKVLAKVFLPSADGFVFQTEDAQKFFSSSIQRKSTIIFNQVAEAFYNIKYEGERKNIVATGRLVPPKDHFYLIDAFEIIKNNVKDNLIIYGEGPLRGQLTEYIQLKGLENRVFLPGSVSNVAETICSAKLYVLSSNHEGMPNGLMEAMAAGIPCVSTDCPCGGPRTLFGEKARKLLVPIANPQALAESMLKVLTSSELMNELSEENIDRAELFRPSVVIKEWDEFIKKTVKS